MRMLLATQTILQLTCFFPLRGERLCHELYSAKASMRGLSQHDRCHFVFPAIKSNECETYACCGCMSSALKMEGVGWREVGSVLSWFIFTAVVSDGVVVRTSLASLPRRLLFQRVLILC